MDEWNQAHYDIIKDNDIDDKEIKLFAILELLHNDQISLHKAHELCTESGLFSDHWIIVDAKLTKIWDKYYLPKLS